MKKIVTAFYLLFLTTLCLSPVTGQDNKLKLMWTKQAHIDEITSIVFSPDGKYLASTANSSDSYIKIYTIDKGSLNKSLKVPGSWHIDYSPDGRTIAAGGFNTIVLCDAESGSIKKTITVASSYSIRSLRFTPDGKSLVCSGMDKKVRIFDTASGNPTKEFIFNQGFGWETAISPDSKIIAGGGNKDITAWKFDTGEKLYTIKPYLEKNKYSPNSDTFCASFTPDNKYLFTAGADGTVRMWDAQTGTLLKFYNMSTGWIFALAISPNGEEVAIGNGWNIEIINIKTGALLSYPKVHNKYIKAIAFSPDGKYLATGSHDKVLKLWKLH